MLNIVICDDEIQDRVTLKLSLNKYFKRQNIEFNIKEYSNGKAMLNEQLSDLSSCNLFFLDVLMPNTNGIKVARSLRIKGITSPFIFLTNSTDFAIESYDVEAFSYLIKPFSIIKLENVLNRYITHYKPKSIFVLNQIVCINNIVFVESSLKYVFIYLQDEKVIKVRGKLDKIEEDIGSKSFLRCHQSYVVNMNYIKSINGNCFITKLDKAVLIRQRNLASFKKIYYDFLIQRSGLNEVNNEFFC